MRKTLAFTLRLGTCLTALVAPSLVQAQKVPQAQPAARSQKIRFNIAAGTLKLALDRWAAQSHRQILYSADEIADGRTHGFKGVQTADYVLFALLADSGFTGTLDASGAVAVTRRNRKVASEDATPEILVSGRRDWSLNIGIERTRSDSQPFIVMTAEDIKRSGAPDLETFLRNELSVNNTAGTSSQAGLDGTADRAARGLSQVNLRGLGSRETLILVDGRRQPGINLGNGTFSQPQITGIPLASIERIEVLASSASSIYGSGASGGAINIVLKHAYRGGELTATYGNTDDLAAGNARIDLSLAKTLEDGRTNINFGGSWRKSQSLPYGDRISIRDDNVAESIRLTGINPLVTFGRPPAGQTPNFMSTTGAPLQLKPQYGGATLSSAIGYIPSGYNGLLTDGVAPLLANIGSYNLKAPAGLAEGGTDSPLIYGTEVFSGMLSVRREMNDWMTLYTQGQFSATRSKSFASRGFTNVTISADSPSNPFVNDLSVAVPLAGEIVPLTNVVHQWSVLGGGIFKLPGGWQANLDASYAHTRYVLPNFPTGVTSDTAAQATDGTINLLRDVAANPPALAYTTGYVLRSDPQISSTLTTSLRLAGPLPIRLPGGKLQVTVNVERSQDRLSAAYSSGGFLGLAYTLAYQPAGRYTLWSGYSEVVLPIISPSNDVPFVKLFDIRVSARGERYTAAGASAPTQCYFDVTPPDATAYAACPPQGVDTGVSSSTRSHVDPMVSFRWQPVDDIMFRASYGTGYLPPTLAQISKQTGQLDIQLCDPLRGLEPVGMPGRFGSYTINAAFGGNPDIAPETSKTLTAGFILTPRIVPRLRFSADWTRITKRNNFFDPINFEYASRLYTGGPLEGTALGEFARFIALHPDRVQRGPAGGGFAVGPITFIDLSLANYVGTRVQSVDFALDYWFPLLGGRVDLKGDATWNRKLEVEAFPEQVTSYLGVSGGASSIAGGFGALPWRGNGSIRWSKGGLGFGLQTLFFDGYYLNADHTPVPAQGAARIPSQTYHNLMLSYVCGNGITFRAIVNNVLDKIPPRDVSVSPLFYSRYGDPLGRNFQLSVTKAF